MGVVGAVNSYATQAAWNAVRETVRGAASGDLGDIAKVAVGAAVLTGAIPVGNGAAVIAGGMLAGRLVDVFV